ncbi:serine hydrolase [Pseudonocardia kujensis]|uniref:D-alanyl-D-alanine carboxypeptidase family protein n=1 Tax=Pseudonocardia kujensis TaxID=1128675 RepID=UPI001E5D8AAA|nr:serine hydrolase [Pseudonocardia kujensis]MCE0767127.1 serine hydrolase [Pseudonocardia kujensis]
MCRWGRATVGTLVAAIVTFLLVEPTAVAAAAAPPPSGASAAAPPPALAAPAPAGVCPGHEAPPGPPAREETVPMAPVAVPQQPVGGPRLGACGDVLPDGAAPPPAVSAAGWVVADLDSGTVLAAHDPHGRQRPASTLKILTTLVVRAELDPDADVVVTPEDVRVDGSKAGIGPGGHYSVRQLLAGLLLNSGNDTAMALARTMGGVPAALQAMQARADRLGALDTRPATPSGLDGPGMSTSAYDLAVLFRVALRDPLVRETLATPTVPFPGFADRPGFQISNDDPLLRTYPGAFAGKTGFTDAARHTFVGAAERNGRRLVVAMVRGEQHPVRMVAQAGALLDYGFALPATAGVGTLVDSRPVEPAPAPAPAPVAVAPAPAAHPVPVPVWAVAATVALILVAGTGVLLARRRHRKRPPDQVVPGDTPVGGDRR